MPKKHRNLKRINKFKKYGFITPKITENNYVLGSGKLGTSGLILNSERDWIPFLPLGEIQKRHFDTNSCTEFGTLNAIDTLKNRLGYSFPDKSERFLAIASENTYDGNDPHKVAETLRKIGVADETDLPFNDSLNSWEEYMTPNPLPQNLKDKAGEWKEKYKFGHEWVFTRGALDYKREKLLRALEISPVGVSVQAWTKKDGVYVKDNRHGDNHWTLLVAGERGKSWMVFDSYQEDNADDYIKELSWDYNFGFAKLYTLNRQPKRCFIGRILNKYQINV